MENNIKEQVFYYLEKYIPSEKKIILGVSGGPDSMALSYFVNEYFEYKKRDKSKVIIAHFNHGQRKESTKEYVFLKKYFIYNTFYWNTNIPSKGQSETTLREKRHTFFSEVSKKEKTTILLLGHNLTDRIETTILSLIRGTGLSGFLSIKPENKKKDITTYRPLIDIPKPDIEKYCKKNKIPYFTDKTNKKSITSRNILRNKVIPQITVLHPGGENNWYNSRKKIYDGLNNTTKSLKNSREQAIPHPRRKVKKWYYKDIKNVSPDLLLSLFTDSYYATQKTLKTIDEYIKKSNGYLYIGGWYLFKSSNVLHCLYTKDIFRTHKYTTKNIITAYGNIVFDGYTYTIPKKYVGYTVRYPKEGDNYKNKRLLKVMLNKKIPVFMRNTTPVVVNKDKIVDILLPPLSCL